MTSNPLRNTYTQEEQERNDILKAQHIRQAAYAARFCRAGASS